MGGVTSVRDLAAPATAVLGVKRRIASGALPGPTIYAAGPALAKLAPNQTSVTSQFLPIDGADDARAKTRRLLDDGVDVVKIFFAERMSPEERTAIVTEAHARGKKVAMHGQTDAEVRLGLQKWAAQRRLLLVEARDHRRPRELPGPARPARRRSEGGLGRLSAAGAAHGRRMTLDAAAVMGADRDNGSVAAGKYADVIAVGGDPLRHIDVLRDPKVIVRHGRRFK